MAKKKVVTLDTLEYYTTQANEKYVSKVKGKDLSTKDFTDSAESKLNGIQAGAQVNKIESVKVNNTAVEINNKTVNIDLSDYETISGASGKYLPKDGHITLTEAQKAELKGLKGDKGETGVGIKSVVCTYQVGSSGITSPTGTWTSTIPSTVAGQFLWTKFVITKTDNSTTTAYSVAAHGATGAKGDKGTIGDTGATFTPSVSSEGVLSWTNDKGKANPSAVNIKGPKGETGPAGTAAGFGTPTASVDANVGTPSVTVTSSGSNTAKVFNFAFKNLKGAKGDKGDKGDSGVSPTAKVVKAGTSNTATITITDASGTTTAQVADGAKGDKGDKGDPGATGPTGPKGADGVYKGITKHTMTSSNTTATLNPNEVYYFPAMASLSITLGTATSMFDEYHFFFTSGSTKTTLTIPSSVKLPDGFEIEANKTYEISIANNLLLCQGWE